MMCFWLDWSTRVFSRYMIDVAHDLIDIDHHAKVSGVYDGRPFFTQISRYVSLRYPVFLVFSRRPHLRVTRFWRVVLIYRSRKRFPSLMFQHGNAPSKRLYQAPPISRMMITIRNEVV